MSRYVAHKGPSGAFVTYCKISCFFPKTIPKIWSKFNETLQRDRTYNQVKGQIVPEIVLLINYWSKFDETSQKDKA